jgi:hypothetical protein
MQEIRKTDHFPKYDSTVISEIMMVYTEYLDLRTPNIWTLIFIVVFVPPFTIALATCQNFHIAYTSIIYS